MDLERLFGLLLSNPENITIKYSNINGVEKLIVNDLDLTIDSIKELITKYKNNIEQLDDCDFLEIIEKVGENIDINEFDSLLNKETFTKEESKLLTDYINYTNDVIKVYLEDKIDKLKIILENL